MTSLDTKSPQETSELKTGRSSGPSVGDLLSATRAQRGDHLQDIARELRIQFAYLEALENSEHEKLPGHTYAIGFIRAYAGYLGLDGEEVVQRFKAETSEFVTPNELIFPIPVAESGIPGGAVIFIGLIIAAVAYGGWYFGTTEDGNFSELISPVPERMAVAARDKPAAAEISVAGEEKEMAPSPSSATAATPSAEQNIVPVAAAEPGNVAEMAVVVSRQPVEPTPPVVTESLPALTSLSGVSETSVDVRQVQEPVRAETVAVIEETEVAEAASLMETTDTPVSESVGDGSDAQLAAIPSAPVLSPQIVSGGGRIYGEENENFRIEVRATINSWIQVRDISTNRLLLTRLLRAGDSYRVPDRPGLQLLTGNAGALEIWVDGKVAPAIGPLGAVRRNVSLDAVSLLEGNAVSE